MNDNQKTTRNHEESRATTAAAEDRKAHTSQDQLTTGTGAEKSSVQTAAIHKKPKRNNRPRPLL